MSTDCIYLDWNNQLILNWNKYYVNYVIKVELFVIILFYKIVF